MASCENCKQSVPAVEMMVARRGDEDILIGPCCLFKKVEPMDQVRFHFEASSKNGLIATVEYGGLTLQYRKNPDQVEQVYRELVGEKIPNTNEVMN